MLAGFPRSYPLLPEEPMDGTALRIVYQYDRLAHKRDEQLALALSPAAYYTENGMAIITKKSGTSGGKLDILNKNWCAHLCGMVKVLKVAFAAERKDKCGSAIDGP